MEAGRQWCRVFVCSADLCPSASRASSSKSRSGVCAGSPGQRNTRSHSLSCRETTDPLRSIKSQPADSLASPNPNCINVLLKHSAMTASPQSAPFRPQLKQRHVAEAEVVHAGVITSHVHRHPWEETGYVPVLRRARQSRPGHFDRGGALPNYPTQDH